MITFLAEEGATSSTVGSMQWLSLAATPAFAAMALMTWVAERGATDFLCSGSHAAWSLSGMPAMYLLMSLFHCAPWLKLVFEDATFSGAENNRRK